MSRVGISTRRVLQLATSGAIVFACLLVLPLIHGKFADAARTAHQKRLADYHMTLQPCADWLRPVDNAQLPLLPGEVDIIFNPALGEAHAVRMSDRYVYTYRGGIATSAESPVSQRPVGVRNDAQAPSATPSPKFPLGADIGGRIARELAYAVDHARMPDPGYKGNGTAILDATWLIFRHGRSCAVTLTSDDTDSRAFKLTRLVYAVDRLAQSNGSDYVRRKTEIVNLLTDLEADRRRFGD